jgi:hypothetical protein
MSQISFSLPRPPWGSWLPGSQLWHFSTPADTMSLSRTATAPAAMTVTEASPLLVFTVASVTRQNFVKKVLYLSHRE